MFKSVLSFIALASATAVSAQPTIGVIDTQVRTGYNSTVESRDFTPPGYAVGVQPTKDGRTHGEAVVDTVIEGAGGSARILHANIFVVNNGGLATSWERAKQSLDWFKSQGVQYVCTNFTLQENDGVRGFVDHAEALGLKIVSSVGNGNDLNGNMNKNFKPYPATDARTIVTKADEQEINNRLARPILKLAKYSSTGYAAKTSNVEKPAIGASFAAARLCGQLAAGKI